jgi:hypothetical protein
MKKRTIKMEVRVTEMFSRFKKLFDPDPEGISELLIGILTLIVGVLFAVYAWAYAVGPVVTNSTLIGSSVGSNLLSGLFIVMFFLGVALLPIGLIMIAIKFMGKRR